MRVKISRIYPYHYFGKYEIERLPVVNEIIDVEHKDYSLIGAISWRVVQVIIREPETPEIVVAELWRGFNLRARKENPVEQAKTEYEEIQLDPDGDITQAQREANEEIKKALEWHKQEKPRRMYEGF
jgi:hypothetical protein